MKRMGFYSSKTKYVHIYIPFCRNYIYIPSSNLPTPFLFSNVNKLKASVQLRFKPLRGSITKRFHFPNSDPVYISSFPTLYGFKLS